MILSSDKIRTLTFYLFIILMTFYWIFSVTALKYVGTVTGTVIFILEYSKREKQSEILFKFALLVFSGLVMELFYTWSFIGVNAFPLLFAHIGMVLFLLRGNVNSDVIKIILVTCFMYCAYFMLTETSAKLVLTGRSTNHISVLLIYLTCIYYIINRINGISINMIPAFFTFLISSWAVGRSGIIASSFLLMGIFLFSKKTKVDYILISIAFLIFFMIFGYAISANLPFTISYNKFVEQELMMDVRFELNREYLEEVDFKSFIFGFDWEIMNTNRLFWQMQNLHNSFFSAHFRLGIFAIIIFCVALFALVKFFIWKDIFFVLLAAILVRAYADTILIPEGPFDFIFYYLVTIGISCDYKKRKKED